MISYIEGEVFCLQSDSIVVKTNGIGYQVYLAQRNLLQVDQGNKVELFIYTHVKEDALELFGFENALCRQIFLLLISVSGIGPKLALAMLSYFSDHELVRALSQRDITTLSKVPGVGKKIAERMSLELKDKVQKLPIPKDIVLGDNERVVRELEEAILGLGFSKAQSDRALKRLDDSKLLDLPFEQLVKNTLNILTGNN